MVSCRRFLADTHVVKASIASSNGAFTGVHKVKKGVENVLKGIVVILLLFLMSLVSFIACVEVVIDDQVIKVACNRV